MSQAELIRLQKYISSAGIASRRKAERLIEQGRVKVNGETIVEMGYKVDPDSDTVSVNNKEIKPAHKGIIMLHKPSGYITSKHDPEGRKTVYQFITKKYASFASVGRLDYNTSGLLLFTNDGRLSESLTHPKFEVVRTYRTEVEGSVSETSLAKLAKGIMLEDGPVKAQATIIENRGKNTLVEIKLREGRNRIVRRMMKKIHHPVISLQRVAFGPFSLGKLKKGQILKFTEKDYYKFRDMLVR